MNAMATNGFFLGWEMGIVEYILITAIIRVKGSTFAVALWGI